MVFSHVLQWQHRASGRRRRAALDRSFDDYVGADVRGGPPDSGFPPPAFIDGTDVRGGSPDSGFPPPAFIDGTDVVGVDPETGFTKARRVELHSLSAGPASANTVMGSWGGAGDPRVRSAIGDGKNVVVSGNDVIAEIASDGHLSTLTPTDQLVFAATGTDEGLPVIRTEIVTMSGVSPKSSLAVLERETGSEIRVLADVELGGTLDYVAVATAVVAILSVYFAAMSYGTRDAVTWFTVSCDW